MVKTDKKKLHHKKPGAYSNEMKSIEDITGSNKLMAFPPGHFFQPDKGFVRYYQVSLLEINYSILGKNEGNLGCFIE